jgi:hypothetical protein
MPSGCLYKTNALFFHMTEFLSQRAAAADTNGKIRKPFYLKTMQIKKSRLKNRPFDKRVGNEIIIFTNINN